MGTKKISLKKLLGVVGFVVIIFIVFYYNHKRIHGSYNFDLFHKEWEIEWIPFHNLKQMISDFGQIKLYKLVLYMMLGLLGRLSLSFLLPAPKKNGVSPFLIFSAILVVFSEAMLCLTSGYLSVRVDINNLIIYGVGLIAGYLCFGLLEKGIQWIVSRFISLP